MSGGGGGEYEIEREQEIRWKVRGTVKEPSKKTHKMILRVVVDLIFGVGLK